MNAWIGPAIVAAMISGLISLVGLYFGGWISIRHEDRRRKEKVRDYQIALRAEIRSELHNLRSRDLKAHLAEIENRYAVEENFSVFPSFPSRHVVFEALKEEIHILPETVIDAVILYWRQRQVIEQFVGDMRDARFSRLGSARQLDMYRDFLAMQTYLGETALQAAKALDRSLGEHSYFNSPASARSDP